jgi:hypothetical protein
MNRRRCNRSKACRRHVIGRGARTKLLLEPTPKPSVRVQYELGDRRPKIEGELDGNRASQALELRFGKEISVREHRLVSLRNAREDNGLEREKSLVRRCPAKGGISQHFLHELSANERSNLGDKPKGDGCGGRYAVFPILESDIFEAIKGIAELGLAIISARSPDGVYMGNGGVLTHEGRSRLPFSMEPDSWLPRDQGFTAADHAATENRSLLRAPEKGLPSI